MSTNEENKFQSTLQSLRNPSSSNLFHLPESTTTAFKRGAVSGVLGIVATFPMVKIAMRQSVLNCSVRAAVLSILNEGIHTLFRGIGPPLIQKTIAISMMFGLFESSMKVLEKPTEKMNVFSATFMAGFIASIFEAILVPFERVQTILVIPQTQYQLRNMRTTFDYLYRNYSMREIFRGCHITTARNCLTIVAFFLARDYIKNTLPEGRFPIVRDFFAGALLGVALTTVFFPLNAIRFTIQSEIGTPIQKPVPVYMRQSLVVRHSRFRPLWNGARTNALRSLVLWGVINASHEYMIKHKIFS